MRILSLILGVFLFNHTRAAEPTKVSGSVNEPKQPQVAVSDAGRVSIAFGSESAIYVTHAEPLYGKFSTPVMIGELPSLALGMRRGPRIAASKSGLTISAISHSDGTLYTWHSGDGKTWTKPVMVNSAPESAREGLHALASDGNQTLALVWLDLRNGKTELWGAISKNGGATWGENFPVYKSPSGTICECCHPSALFTRNGELVVMWRNFAAGSRDMYFTVTKDHGTTFSSAEKLGTGTWKLQGCPMDGGSLAEPGGKLEFAWRRENQLFLSSVKGDEVLLAKEGVQPVIVPTADKSLFLWNSGGDLWWRRGIKGEASVLAAKAGYAVGVYDKASRASVIAWEGEDGIYVQRCR